MGKEGRGGEELDLRADAPPPQKGDWLCVSLHVSYCTLLGPLGASIQSAHTPKQMSFRVLTRTQVCNAIQWGVSCDNAEAGCLQGRVTVGLGGKRNASWRR